MQTRFNVDRAYPGLGSFFDQLAIPTAPADILVQELEAVTKDSSPQLSRIYTVLDDACDWIRKSNHSAVSTLWLSQLADLAIFPVQAAGGSIVLAKITDDFYIPDGSGELASLFADSCRLLHTPEELPLLRLNRLLDYPGFASHIKRLEECARIEVTPVGPPVYQKQTSQEFTSRLPYIRW